MTEMDVAMRYRDMARRCGVWPTARRMFKDGYSVWQARWVLLSREEYPVLTRVVYYGRFRNERDVREDW